MPKITRQDWEMLRNRYHVAFSRMHPDLFKLLLEKVYSPKNNPGSDCANSGELDETDALMIYLAHAEPPTRHAEPTISPGG